MLEDIHIFTADRVERPGKTPKPRKVRVELSMTLPNGIKITTIGHVGPKYGLSNRNEPAKDAVKRALRVLEDVLAGLEKGEIPKKQKTEFLIVHNIPESLRTEARTLAAAGEEADLSGSSGRRTRRAPREPEPEDTRRTSRPRRPMTPREQRAERTRELEEKSAASLDSAQTEQFLAEVREDFPEFKITQLEVIPPPPRDKNKKLVRVAVSGTINGTRVKFETRDTAFNPHSAQRVAIREAYDRLKEEYDRLT